MDDQALLTKPWHYDKREVFMREIEPIMGQLLAACEKHGIPYAMAFQTFYSEAGAGIVSTHGAQNDSGELIPVSSQIAAIMGVNSAFADAADGNEAAKGALEACGGYIKFFEAEEEHLRQVKAQYANAH